MKYDVINIDGDNIGEWRGNLVRDTVPPECWQDIKDWPYFKNLPRQVVGTYGFKRITVLSKGDIFVKAVSVEFIVNGNAFSVATIIPQDDQPGLSDSCKDCRVPGRFVRTALVCPQCNGFIGGF